MEDKDIQDFEENHHDQNLSRDGSASGKDRITIINPDPTNCASPTDPQGDNIESKSQLKDKTLSPKCNGNHNSVKEETKTMSQDQENDGNRVILSPKDNKLESENGLPPIPESKEGAVSEQSKGLMRKQTKRDSLKSTNTLNVILSYRTRLRCKRFWIIIGLHFL